MLTRPARPRQRARPQVQALIGQILKRDAKSPADRVQSEMKFIAIVFRVEKNGRPQFR